MDRVELETASNWYLNVEEGTVNWWKMLPPRAPVPKGATRGRDHTGRDGMFVGHKMKILSYQSYAGQGSTMYRFNGDRKAVLADPTTHYKNPKHPTQCVNGLAELQAQLDTIKTKHHL